MKIAVIDGQGGKLGALLVEAAIHIRPDCEVIAVGTNAVATAAMLHAGAKTGATGENPVRVVCREADVILGPIGIVVADALLGEVTPDMALAIGQSKATKLLLPVSHCKNLVVGTEHLSLSELVRLAAERLKSL